MFFNNLEILSVPLSLGAVAELLIFGIGACLAIEDYRSNKVNMILTLLFTACCCYKGFSEVRTPCFAPLFIFLGIGAIFYVFKKTQAFGLADYIIVFALSFVMPGGYWPYFLILCGAIGCLSGLMFRQHKAFPFIPAMMLSYFIINYSKL